MSARCMRLQQMLTWCHDVLGYCAEVRRNTPTSDRNSWQCQLLQSLQLLQAVQLEVSPTFCCLGHGCAGLLVALLQLVQVDTVPAGKVLTREGAVPDQLVVVRQGAVQVTGGTLPGVLAVLTAYILSSRMLLCAGIA